MSDRRSARKENLRAGLIAAAGARIAAHGLQALRARDVTADVGSALGGLYNAFEDLDDLVLHVNAQTLANLRDEAAARLAEAENPRDAMHVLADAYLRFAQSHHELWSALFQHRLAPGKELPDWYKDQQTSLIRLIVQPLSELEPSLDAATLLLRARTFFAAVHGIVTISTENRFIGLTQTDLDTELTRFVDILALGSEALRTIRDK